MCKTQGNWWNPLLTETSEPKGLTLFGGCCHDDISDTCNERWNRLPRTMVMQVWPTKVAPHLNGLCQRYQHDNIYQSGLCQRCSSPRPSRGFSVGLQLRGCVTFLWVSCRIYKHDNIHQSGLILLVQGLPSVWDLWNPDCFGLQRERSCRQKQTDNFRLMTHFANSPRQAPQLFGCTTHWQWLMFDGNPFTKRINPLWWMWSCLYIRQCLLRGGSGQKRYDHSGEESLIYWPKDRNSFGDAARHINTTTSTKVGGSSWFRGFWRKPLVEYINMTTFTKVG